MSSVKVVSFCFFSSLAVLVALDGTPYRFASHALARDPTVIEPRFIGSKDLAQPPAWAKSKNDEAGIPPPPPGPPPPPSVVHGGPASKEGLKDLLNAEIAKRKHKKKAKIRGLWKSLAHKAVRAQKKSASTKWKKVADKLGMVGKRSTKKQLPDNLTKGWAQVYPLVSKAEDWQTLKDANSIIFLFLERSSVSLSNAKEIIDALKEENAWPKEVRFVDYERYQGIVKHLLGKLEMGIDLEIIERDKCKRKVTWNKLWEKLPKNRVLVTDSGRFELRKHLDHFRTDHSAAVQDAPVLQFDLWKKQHN